MFAYIANQILQEDFKREYWGVIRRFIFEVSPYKVYHYYIFKRSAFDARLFKKLFFKNAHDIYEFLAKTGDDVYYAFVELKNEYINAKDYKKEKQKDDFDISL